MGAYEDWLSKMGGAGLTVPGMGGGPTPGPAATPPPSILAAPPPGPAPSPEPSPMGLSAAIGNMQGVPPPPVVAPPPAPKPEAEFAAKLRKDEVAAAKAGTKLAKDEQAYAGGIYRKAPPPLSPGQRVQRDQRDLVKSYAREQADVQGIAAAEGAKTEAKAATLDAAAEADRQRIAELQQHNEISRQKQDEWRAESLRLSDENRKGEVNPNRYMDDVGVGGRIAMVIGGFLGGLSAAKTGGRNLFLDQMNRIIDDDIAAQREKFAKGEKALEYRDKVYAQMVAATGSTEAAEMQLRKMHLENAQMQLDSQAAKLDSPIFKARADQASTQLGREGVKTELAFDTAAAKAADAAAGAQIAAQRKNQEEFKARVDKYMLEGGLPLEDARKLAISQMGNVTLPGEAIGALPGKPGSGASGPRETQRIEGEKLQRSSNELNKQIDDVLASPMLDKLGLNLALTQQIPGSQRLYPKSSLEAQDIKNLNIRIQNAIGAVAKDAEGKPQQAMLERYEHAFQIELSDTPEVARQKLEGVRAAVNSLGRRQGAQAPEPTAKPPPGLKVKE
jgi:hypothetical protein